MCGRAPEQGARPQIFCGKNSFGFLELFLSVMRITDMSITDAAATPPNPAAAQLPDDPATLKSMLLEVLATLRARERDNEALRHRVDVLLRRLFGPRGERFNPDQLLLFADLTNNLDTSVSSDQAATSAAAVAPRAAPRRCRPHGRRRLPDNLPREARHHTLGVSSK